MEHRTVLNNDNKIKLRWPIARIAVAIVVLVILFQASWLNARAGFASLLSTYAAKSKKIDPAQAALPLSSTDPEIHFVRGAILEAQGDYSTAIEEYEQAVRLRPRDYVLWLALARVRELKGNLEGAIVAARQAVPLAPFYAQPHWQLGNMLVRRGKVDEGFRELRFAGESDQNLMPVIIELAFQLSGNDMEFIKRAIQPQTPDSYKALAEYFKKKNRVTDAIEMLSAAGSGAEQERRLYLEELISAGKFTEAAGLWSMDHPEVSQNMGSHFRNPGFEQESTLDKPGFDWRQETKADSLSLSLDPNQPKEGHTSLRIDLKGDSNPGVPVISQLILVAPGTRYQLQFAARSEGLVSGGMPYLAVVNATNNIVLGQTGLFPKGTVGWQDYVLDFNSAENISAIKVMLRRVPCSSSPCPVFGHLWLDNFSLRKL
jgi:tetratricopeptide (TPR) repeat protein